MSKKERKNQIKNLEEALINTLKADNSITVEGETKSFSDNLSHVVRDITDVSKNVFFGKDVNPQAVISKLKKLNNSRIAVAIPLSMGLAITN